MQLKVDILGYLSPMFRKYKEYKVIAQAINPELDLLWNEIMRAQNNQFIDSSDEYGVSRKEKIIGITPKDTDSLEDRKFRLNAREIDKLPYTIRTLKRKLSSLCGEDGYKLNIDYNNFTISIQIALTSKSAYSEVEELLDKMIPENMIINLSLLYNKHSLLSKYTHKQLSSYTHKQLREEVL